MMILQERIWERDSEYGAEHGALYVSREAAVRHLTEQGFTESGHAWYRGVTPEKVEELRTATTGPKLQRGWWWYDLPEDSTYLTLHEVQVLD